LSRSGFKKKIKKKDGRGVFLATSKGFLIGQRARKYESAPTIPNRPD